MAGVSSMAVIAARMEPKGRREAPSDDRLSEIQGSNHRHKIPDCAAVDPGYHRAHPTWRSSR